MKGEELPDDANVVHYVSPSRVTETGEAGWEGFRRNNDGEPPSVHWLQQLGSEKAKQVSAARKVSRVQLRSNGRLGELRVGDVVARRDEIRFVHDPLCATDQYPADPSHSDMMGVPERGAANERLVCEVIASCVTQMHKAVEE